MKSYTNIHTPIVWNAISRSTEGTERTEGQKDKSPSFLQLARVSERIKRRRCVSCDSVLSEGKLEVMQVQIIKTDLFPTLGKITRSNGS